MAKIKTKPYTIKYGPERKKISPEIRSALAGGGIEVEVPEDLMHILEKGTYEIIKEKKVEIPKKEVKKPKKTKKITKVEEKVSIEDLDTSYKK